MYKEGTPCERMTVKACGISFGENTVKVATNRNYTSEGCTREPGKCGCTHAEINLLKILPNPDVVIVTHSPCINCAMALVEAGVKRVEYVEVYRLRAGLLYLMSSDVEVVKIKEVS